MGESVLCEASRRLKPAAPCLVHYSNINKVGGENFGFWAGQFHANSSGAWGSEGCAAVAHDHLAARSPGAEQHGEVKGTDDAVVVGIEALARITRFARPP